MIDLLEIGVRRIFANGDLPDPWGETAIGATYIPLSPMRNSAFQYAPVIPRRKV